jgi:hypothetical protein
MSALTLPKTLRPGDFENVNDVTDNFTAIRTLVNGGLDGANLTQATGEALSATATNTPRRAMQSRPLDSTEAKVLNGTYQRLIRAPAVVMPTGGLLHVSAMGIMDVFGAVTWRLCIQLNGVIVRSRFGVASGASGGLMERTMSTAGSTTLWYTDISDVGLGQVDATAGELPLEASFGSRPIGAFVPIAVGPGSFVVDVLAIQDAGPALAATNAAAVIYVRTEGF